MKLTKTTAGLSLPGRSYDDACGAAHGLDLIGERWAILVMRELMLGPLRFSDLRAALPGISANVLTQRLQGLEGIGALVRRKLAPPAASQVYELTPWGYEAEPIMQALGRWATRSPLHDPMLPLSPVSLMLSFRTMFAADLAGDFEARIGFRLDGEDYMVQIRKGRIDAQRTPIESPDVTFTGTPGAVAAAVYGGVPIAALEADGALQLEGYRTIANRFVTLFPLPPKISPAA
ncbi:helix-turn-helix domain-containing protein [Emcibacter sp. SYSU 3D8]|uniref:winged helix-turn-helix transcriptional regulator n=1 Tax=Emcibacter sp. SYSU 3D8 TaxID=3133969 RepID=UPI0031FE9C83